MIRLELTTTRPPDVYANQLRYIPIPDNGFAFGVQSYDYILTPPNNLGKKIKKNW